MQITEQQGSTAAVGRGVYRAIRTRQIPISRCSCLASSRGLGGHPKWAIRLTDNGSHPPTAPTPTPTNRQDSSRTDRPVGRTDRAELANESLARQALEAGSIDAGRESGKEGSMEGGRCKVQGGRCQCKWAELASRQRAKLDRFDRFGDCESGANGCRAAGMAIGGILMMAVVAHGRHVNISISVLSCYFHAQFSILGIRKLVGNCYATRLLLVMRNPQFTTLGCQ